MSDEDDKDDEDDEIGRYESSCERLGVSLAASRLEIHKSYRRMALQCHPDKNDGRDDKMVSLNLAYEYLDSLDENERERERDEAEAARELREAREFLRAGDPIASFPSVVVKSTVATSLASVLTNASTQDAVTDAHLLKRRSNEMSSVYQDAPSASKRAHPTTATSERAQEQHRFGELDLDTANHVYEAHAHEHGDGQLFNATANKLLLYDALRAEGMPADLSQAPALMLARLMGKPEARHWSRSDKPQPTQSSDQVVFF